MMKRVSVIGLLVTLIIAGATCVSFATWEGSFYGGISRLSPDETNEVYQQDVHYMVYWEGGGGNVNEVSGANPVGANLWYVGEFSPMAGAGIQIFSETGGFTWSEPWWGQSLEIKDTFRVRGVLAHVGYAWGRNSLRAIAAVGGGYYWVTLERTIPVEVLWWMDWYEWTAKKNQFGAHALARIDYFVTDDIAVGLEFFYRVLNISEMEYTEHDVPAWVGQTRVQEVNLGGSSVFLVLIIRR